MCLTFQHVFSHSGNDANETADCATAPGSFGFTSDYYSPLWWQARGQGVARLIPDLDSLKQSSRASTKSDNPRTKEDGLMANVLLHVWCNLFFGLTLPVLTGPENLGAIIFDGTPLAAMSIASRVASCVETSPL